MDYLQARKYIIDAECYQGDMGLGNIRNLLKKIGNPQDDLKFIHIAGTNGKGSVMAYISTILSTARYCVGRYVSPTLYAYRERIQVDGLYIEEEAFTRHMEKLVWAIRQMLEEGMAHPTPFEIETALAFLYFKEKQCDIVVLECGMGGRDDATNIVENTIMAVFTSISTDHMEYLGNTLEEIATNKAGIIKPEAIVVSGRQALEVEETLWAICTERCNQLIVAKPREAVVRESTLVSQTFRYHGEEVTIAMAGSHQIENAVLALECVNALNHIGYRIEKEDVYQGFLQTRWEGRFTLLREDPYFVVDGAHNPDAAAKLQQSLKMYFQEKEFVFIMGVLKDKQYEVIAETMAPMAKKIFTITTPDNPRALEADVFAQIISRYNEQVQPCKSIEEAVAESLKIADKQDVIVAFGSLSFIGAITRIVTGEEEHD